MSDLLHKMMLEIQGIRKAVISDETYTILRLSDQDLAQ